MKFQRVIQQRIRWLNKYVNGEADINAAVSVNIEEQRRKAAEDQPVSQTRASSGRRSRRPAGPSG